MPPHPRQQQGSRQPTRVVPRLPLVGVAAQDVGGGGEQAPPLLVSGPGVGQHVGVAPPLAGCAAPAGTCAASGRSVSLARRRGTHPPLCRILCWLILSTSLLPHVTPSRPCLPRPRPSPRAPASPPLGAPSQVIADPTSLVRLVSLAVRASVQCMYCKGATRACRAGYVR